MTAATSTIRDVAVRFGPVVVAVALFAVGFVALVQPEIRSAHALRAESVALEQRLGPLLATVGRGGNVDTEDPESSMRAFRARLGGEEQTAQVAEALTRIIVDPADERDVRGISIEVGDANNWTTEDGGKRSQEAEPAVSAPLDPRLALFSIPFDSTPITVRFEATYSRLGQFLWRLRDLPTLVEVRSVEIARALPLLKVKIVLLALRTSAKTPAPPVSPAVQPIPRVATAVRDPGLHSTDLRTADATFRPGASRWP